MKPVLTLTLWQKKASGFPTRAAEGTLEEPTVDAFKEAVARLLAMAEPNAKPFQIVARMGDSSRGFQLGQGWSEEQIATELWEKYQGLMGVVG